MSNLINVRVLQHDTADQIRIGSSFTISNLDEAEKSVIASYDAKLAWCGGFKKSADKYYQRIALVNATTLEVIRVVYSK